MDKVKNYIAIHQLRKEVLNFLHNYYIMKLHFLLIGLVFLLFTSCTEFIGEQGNGERITEKIRVDSFNQINISGAFDVTLIPSDSDEIIIETDENLFEYIVVRAKGSTLNIDTDRRLNSKEGIQISIPVNEIERIVSSGASIIKSSDKLHTKELDVVLSGAGKINLNLEASSVDVGISGATMVYLEGSTQNLNIDMSGAGSLEAGYFETKDCSVSISGVGKVLVNVSGNLSANVSGLGKVEYVGEPESVQGDVSGVGNVSKAK
jgi:hypothetical protein